MRYGYWLPVFGGWLRNVPDEGMSASWNYVKHLAQRSEKIGFDITLIAELFMNDIKGIDADSLEAWSTAAALAAVTETLELMVAVRPTIHEPKPVRRPRPTIYAGGESPAAKELISRGCDAYVMHGDPPERVAPKIADMSARREKLGLGPMQYGVAAYAIVRETEAEARA